MPVTLVGQRGNALPGCAGARQVDGDKVRLVPSGAQDSTGGTLTEIKSAANLKKITREQFLADRKKFYTAEEKLNGGEWDGNVAKRAEDKQRLKYANDGYDGLDIAEDKQ